MNVEKYMKVNMDEVGKMSYHNQVLSSIAVCISYFILSGIFGFPTIALPALLKNQTESNDTSFLDQTVFLSEDEGSIFVYIYCLIGMVMCTIGGILSGKYGRKTIISISAPCIGLGWLLIGLAQEKIILFLGRIIVSTFGLLYTSSAGAYISETVHPSLRASLVVVSPVLLAFGYFMVWGLSSVITWRIIALISIVPCIFLACAMAILPETPYWLIEHNRYEEAEKSLKFFRGSLYDVNPELEEIHQRHLSKDKSQSYSWMLKRLFSKAFLRPFLSVGIIPVIFVWSGFDIVQIYMVNVLEGTGSSIDPKYGPMIAGGTRAILSCLGPFIVKIIPPKILFTIAQLIHASCISVLGILAYWKTYHTINSDLGWIPMTAIALVIATRAIGTLPVTQIFYFEAYPTEIRTQAMSLNETMWLGLSAVHFQLYPFMKNSFGLHGAFCFYSVMAFICAFWGAVTIQDNRGKSLVKVEEFYEEKFK